MFFYHRRTQSVCAGMSLALCTSADFCQQSQSPVPGDSKENNPVPSNSAEQSTKKPDIFDDVTPVPGSQEKGQLDSRIQRTSLVGTRPPITLLSRDTFSVKFAASGEEDVSIPFTGPVENTDERMVS